MADKEIIVVGGPNGAGKTTFVEQYLRQRPMAYLSADAIAKEISPADPEGAAVAAGREFLVRLDKQLQRGESLIVESTLSGKSFRHALEKARVVGFEISILFIFTDGPETCVARVEQRARGGGHRVPEADIRRRFARSLMNFWTIYRHLAEEWTLMYNAGSDAVRVAYFQRPHLVVQAESLLTEFWRLAGIIS